MMFAASVEHFIVSNIKAIYTLHRRVMGFPLCPLSASASPGPLLHGQSFDRHFTLSDGPLRLS